MKHRLPPSCYVKDKKRGYVVFRPKVKSKPWLEHDKNGFLKPPIPLGKVSDGYNSLYSKYKNACKILEPNNTDINSLSWISDNFQKSNQFKKLTKETRDRYETASKVLSHEIKINGNVAEFGDLKISQIKRPMIIRLMDKRLTSYKDRGLKGESMINYEIRYLSSATTWALNYIDNVGITTNPFKGIPKFKEVAAKRYVTDDEYELQLGFASSYLPAFFEVCYLCATRQIEARHLRKSDVVGDLLVIERRKGSQDNAIKMSERLKAAVQWALENCAPSSPWLFTDRNGKQITRHGLQSNMSRLKAKMKSQGMDDSYWNLHALKHKGKTDSDDDNITGHLTESMKSRYDHSLKVHDAVR